MENVCDILVRQIYANGNQYDTANELKNAILTAWQNLNPVVIQYLVASKPDPLFDVIRSSDNY